MRTRRETVCTRPRVGIDLHVVKGIYQGSRTHCLELFSRVISLCPDFDFFVVTTEPEALLLFNPSFASANVQIISIAPAVSAQRLLWQMPRIAGRFGLSLLHLQYIVPPIALCPTAVTVHDILFETYPQYFERLFVKRSRLLVPFSIRRSALVFTVSDFSRRQICSRYSIPEERVTTIPNGVDTGRFYPGNAGSDIVRKLGLQPGAYFLTVGRLEPRKNHTTLLRAWAKLSHPRPRLVIAGQRDFGYREALGLIDSLGLGNDILLLENISDTDLPALYRNAQAFVYCSWAEGFGMPILEALASGVPVIAPTTTAVPEVCGDAALLIDPARSEEIAGAVRTLIEQNDRRKQLVQRGSQRVREFNWERSATIVRNTYLRYFGRLTEEKIEGTTAGGAASDR